MRGVPAALPGTPLEERFWARVLKVGPDECWEWRGAELKTGYGLFSFRLKGQQTTRGAHRLAYEFAVGPIPHGLELDHLCRNRGCVNPAHLEAVTRKENHRRALPFLPRGADHHNGAKTHCPQGHPYDENSYNRYGRRYCKPCMREHVRVWRQKNRRVRAS